MGANPLALTLQYRIVQKKSDRRGETTSAAGLFTVEVPA